jgi:hypothetical protein
VLALTKRWKRPEACYRRWHRELHSPLELPLKSELSAATEPSVVATEPYLLGRVQFVEVEPALWVANLIGQNGLLRDTDQPPIRYTAILEGLNRVFEFCDKHGATVHAPRFGAGLAGGEWPLIEALLYTTLVNQVHAKPSNSGVETV